MDITHTLNETLKPVFDYLALHPYIKALVIASLGLFLAKFVDWLVIGTIKKVVHKTDGKLDDRIVGIIHRPLFYSVMLVSFGMAVHSLQLEATVESLAISLLKTMAVFIWSGFLIQLSRLALRSMSLHPTRFQAVSSQTLPLFENLAMLLIVGTAIYLIFSAWNIDMTAWLASAGIVGIAVGFAAKDTLANLFSGVFILADAPYKIGDYVVLDSGERGEVTHIGIRSTRILTRDDVEVTIPNSIMGNTKITNESGGPYKKFRIRVPVGVAYGSDIDKVRAILMDVAEKDPTVCRNPESRVRFRRFGASSLDFELLCWVDEPMLRGRVIDGLNSAIYKQFQSEGVEIPYSKHDLYIKELPGQSRES